MRVTLTETATKTITLITTATVDALHDFREIQLSGELTLPFPRQGVYVIDQYLEDKRIARAHFFVDDVNDPMAYKLRDEDIQRVKEGESLMLARDSVNVDSITPKELEQNH